MTEAANPSGSAAHKMVPIEEGIANALAEAGFDESDVINAVEAVAPLVAQHERVWEEWNSAIGAIEDAVDLIGRFDPACGSARTRAFLGDLERILRGKS